MDDWQEVKPTPTPEPELSGLKKFFATAKAGGPYAHSFPMTHEDATKLVQGLVGTVPMAGTEAQLSNFLGKVANKIGLGSLPAKLTASATRIAAPTEEKAVELGRTLVQQGLSGTKGGLTKQVAEKLSEHGKNLTNAVKSIPGSVTSEEAALNVAKLKDKIMTSEGYIPEQARAAAKKIDDRVTDILGRGNQSPEDVLKLKRIAQNGGGTQKKLFNKTGDPTAGLEADMLRAEAEGYGSSLEGAYQKHYPNEPNQVADSNQALEALLKAREGLKKPGEGVIGRILKNTGAAAIGTAVGGPVMGAATVAGREIAKTPLAKTMAAQAMQKTGEMVAPAVGAAYRKNLTDIVTPKTDDWKEVNDWVESK